MDYAIARQMMILVDALDASLRVADEAALSSIPWVRVASRIEDAEEGGYYMDFRDVPALMAAFNQTQEPTQEELDDMLRVCESGEWYADPNRGVVTGRVTEPMDMTGMDHDITFWMPESEELFALVKVRPVSQPETPTGPETPTQPETPTEPETPPTPTQPEGGSQSSGTSFLQRLTDLFNRIVSFFRNLFRR